MINSQEINDINLRIDGYHSDTFQIMAEKGKGFFGKTTTVTWEVVKAFFVNTVTNAGNPVPTITFAPKLTESYVAEAYLPCYDKRIHVQISIVSWTK